MEFLAVEDSETKRQKAPMADWVARTGEQGCKVYHNSKARYIQKVGEMRHQITGSSVEVKFSSSAEVLASTMQGPPVVQGLGR
ncbi:hypothetical protein DPMN_185056 [Dreissena polymorpha]|uniref:Uncharacterized protein n=1 Tax=Dreissena polymorpha TaxID=45954 RepID=A0A9D4DLG6_DREPO|nr:hypothetical protein DPMN_185056 [Dreissena polymorpha]